MRNDGMRRPVGCISAIMIVFLVPTIFQSVWSIQSARALAHANKMCSTNRVFQIIEKGLVRNLLEMRMVPAYRGRALVSTARPSWHSDPNNISLETATYEAKVKGKTAFIIHDVAVHPRTLLDPIAGVKLYSFHCLAILDSPLTDLVFAR